MADRRLRHELADSIAEIGLRQPIVIGPRKQLIAGEYLLPQAVASLTAVARNGAIARIGAVAPTGLSARWAAIAYRGWLTNWCKADAAQRPIAKGGSPLGLPSPFEHCDDLPESRDAPIADTDVPGSFIGIAEHVANERQ